MVSVQSIWQLSAVRMFTEWALDSIAFRRAVYRKPCTHCTDHSSNLTCLAILHSSRIGEHTFSCLFGAHSVRVLRSSAKFKRFNETSVLSLNLLFHTESSRFKDRTTHKRTKTEESVAKTKIDAVVNGLRAVIGHHCHRRRSLASWKQRFHRLFTLNLKCLIYSPHTSSHLVRPCNKYVYLCIDKAIIKAHNNNNNNNLCKFALNRKRCRAICMETYT